MSISRNLRLYVYTNKESLKSGGTLDILSTELNIPDQECKVRVLQVDAVKDIQLRGRRIELPACDPGQVIEVALEAELTNVNRLEHVVSDPVFVDQLLDC